jgi:hypothetical protein
MWNLALKSFNIAHQGTQPLLLYPKCNPSYKFSLYIYISIFRKNIPAYNKSHLHKFHLQSNKDLGYGLVGHDKVLQFDMLGVNILRNKCINFRVAIPENLQSNDGRYTFPCQQRIPPRPQGTVAWLKTCDNRHTDTQASCSQGQAATLT